MYVKMNRIEIVVAKYKEDISWTRNFENVIIYDKSNNKDLPNIGREAHTYIHHIIEHWNNLANITVFLQGNPHDHTSHYENGEQSMMLSTFIDFLISSARANGFSQNYSYRPMDAIYEAKKGSNYEVPDSFTISIHSYFKRYTNTEIHRNIKFYVGAQFAVSKEIIQCIPLWKWKEMLDSLSYSYTPVTAHYMERIWYLMFKDASDCIISNQEKIKKFLL